MTIRTAILRGTLALVFGSILLSGAVSFYQFRQALQSEIARTLQVTSTALLERVDAYLFDRLEDVREWRLLQVMQDIRVGDVDKRLSRLLTDLRQGHGPVYDALFCTDQEGRVVASSQASRIDTTRMPAPAAVREARGDNAEVVVETLATLDRAGGPQLVLRTTVPDAFGTGTLGYLYAVLNWNHVKGFLRDSVGGTPRAALLVNTSGRVIAESGAAELGADAPTADLSRWLDQADDASPVIQDRAALGTGPLLVGVARTSYYHKLSGFDWHLLVVEPTGIAFKPVWRLAAAMILALVVTMVVAGWVSHRVSGRIARPIARLTEFARRLRGGEQPPPPPVHDRITEVRELSRAFEETIEALRQSREQLVRAGKLAVVGEMAAIMAHEVRTPLGILRSSAQLLERQPELTEEGRELTGYIQSETDRLGALVNTLLETARPRPPSFRPADLRGILEHAVALVETRAAKNGVPVALDPGRGDAVLTCDREQLIQVFLNLLINAIQYSPEGHPVSVQLRCEAKALVVHVDDAGPGVPDTFQHRVFDPFFTQREGGIGLGLTVVQQIVEAHGGRIDVGNSPAGGARFSVRLPRHNEEGAA